jgi:hypothetical protein
MSRVMTRSALIVAAGLAMAPSTVRAQAFVPAQGEGVVSFLYQDQDFRYHYGRAGTVPTDIGPIYSRSTLADVTFGLTDKIAVGFSLPWIATRYVGPRPHPLPDLSGPNPIDDGTWHSTVQDLRFEVRYNVTRNLGNKGIVVTPYVGSITPSHDYPYFAHAGFGRDLNEVQVGVTAAKLFERGVPGLIVQGRYGYGFVEQVLDVSHNRSLGSVEVAYFVTPKLRVMGLTAGQITHGGLNYSGPPSLATLGPIVFPHHDQLEQSNMLALGAGASYSFSDSVDVFGSLMHTAVQQNGHGLDLGVTVGLSWSFTTPLAKTRALGTTAENSLVKCLCEKGTK